MNNFSHEARTVKEVFKCTVCRRDFKEKSELKQHQVVYNGQRPYKCNQCDKCYKPLEDIKNINKILVESKKSTSHGKALKDCGNLPAHSKTRVKECCSTTSNLDQHHFPQAVHGASKPRMIYKYNECSDVISDATGFTQHQENGMEYKCTKCGKAYNHPDVLKQHLRTHIYKCTECGSVYDHYETFKEHLKIHTALEAYKCSHCEGWLKTLESLHEHIRYCVSSRKCAECGKVFSSSSVLSKHLRIHRGEKPYQCTQCDKCFRSSSNLNSHLKTHSGVKPFSCAECDATFTHKISLRHHNTTIHGYVPDLSYKCSHCGRGFTTKFGLTRHKCPFRYRDTVHYVSHAVIA